MLVAGCRLATACEPGVMSFGLSFRFLVLWVGPRCFYFMPATSFLILLFFLFLPFSFFLLYGFFLPGIFFLVDEFFKRMVLHEFTLKSKFHHLKTKKLHPFQQTGKAFTGSLAVYL